MMSRWIVHVKICWRETGKDKDLHFRHRSRCKHEFPGDDHGRPPDKFVQIEESLHTSLSWSCSLIFTPYHAWARLSRWSSYLEISNEKLYNWSKTYKQRENNGDRECKNVRRVERSRRTTKEELATSFFLHIFSICFVSFGSNGNANKDSNRTSHRQAAWQSYLRQ